MAARIAFSDYRAAVAAARVLVVGDVMLDRYWFGEVERISPEAPVPVVRIARHEERPGGAANVARNVTALGAKCRLLSVVGNDEAARTLEGLLEADKVQASLHRDEALSTTVKTDAIGLFTGQIGWAWNAALLYVKGGAAVTDNSFNIFDTATGVGLVTSGATRWGGTLGVGFEYGFSPNWSVGIEYDHLWMGTANNSFTTADPRLAGVLNDRVRQDVDMLTLRVNYRFGGYGVPVTARY